MKSYFEPWERIPWTLLNQSSWRHMFALWIILSLSKTLPQIVTMIVISVIFGILFSVRYLLVALFLGAYAWAQCTSYYRLSNFRGPLWASITNLWMVRSVYLRRAHLDLYHAYQKYGELTRIGPNVLLTSDPDLVQHMSSPKSGYTRAQWYAGQKLEVGHDNLLSTVDDNIHTKKRAQMAMGYSGKDVEGVEVALDKHILSFLDLIRRKYISTSSDLRPLDLARRVSFFVMDFTTDIAFGHPWGCLVNDEDVDKWFESAAIFLPVVIMVSTIPWLAQLFSIPLVGKFVGPSDKDKTGPGKILRAVKEVVRRRFDLKDHEQKRDMMGSFIRHGISRNDVVAEAALQIAVGTDTTATTIRTTMLYIMTNPRVYHKLQTEIDSTMCRVEIIPDKLARTMPYLQAVIKEGSRICPPTTGILSKKAPPAGENFKGNFIPGGTEIGQCAWGLQRSKEVYGDDSECFRPERWLEAKGERLEKMEKSLGLLWGYGKFSCLGKHIALLELNKVFFELLKHFEFTLIDPTRPWKCENVGLWLQSELYVKVTERICSAFVV